MKYYISPNDEKCIADNDTLSLQNALNYAESSQINKVIISNNSRTNNNVWEIEESVLIPSNMHIVLDNCRIVCKNNCEIFRNSNVYQDYGYIKHGEQKNIVFTGIGEAIIEGNADDLLLFHNTRNLEINNIRFINHGLNCIGMSFCHNVKIMNITIENEGIKDEQVGILIRRGCHQMIIDNINGSKGKHLIELKSQPERVEYLVFEQNEEITGAVLSNLCFDNAKDKCVYIYAKGEIYNISKDNSAIAYVAEVFDRKDRRNNIKNILIEKIKSQV